ncbi:tetraspanin-11-like [Notothenia coriiceps]|uniref:Tetraspanin-11-like n=1 Tax=Notothenia coriiceps TaxID=8208 RepID=A0A6I9Q624_9TELE|nr:PREDICTED: tetraspanin-11-like [Notothenia coriiceps]
MLDRGLEEGVQLSNVEVRMSADVLFVPQLSVVVEDSLADMIHEYKNSTADFRKTVDKLQEDWKCCGSNSSTDWRGFGPDGNSVPDSCCVKVAPNCGVGAMMNATKVHQTVS